jgi:NAD(P)H-flavin reductase
MTATPVPYRVVARWAETPDTATLRIEPVGELEKALGQDLVVVAGGIGLAPLRTLIRDAVAAPAPYGRLNVLVGARTPAGLTAKIETRRCATGHCGHCQLGPLLLCRDGPIVGWEQAEPLLRAREW